MASAIILGTTNDITTCECCGKTNLKKTVVLDVDGAVLHYGIDCAGRAILGAKSAKNSAIIDKRARAVDAARKDVANGLKDRETSRSAWNLFGAAIELRGTMLRTPWGEVAA